jgi:hypothetical protein
VRDIPEHPEKNSTALHALDIVALRLNMLLLNKNTVSMPDFILAMEDAHKKAKCVDLPILDIKLAMYATPPFSKWATTRRKLIIGKNKVLP